MPFSRLAVVILFVTLVGAGSAAAAGSRESLLVSPAWLAAHLDDPGLVVLHIGNPKEFEARHLPGARPVSQSDISTSGHSETELMLQMLPAEDLRARLEALGISDTSRIIVYFAQGAVTPSTRVMFTLDYAGLGDRSSLLDGGLDAWVRGGHPVASGASPAGRGRLAPLKLRPLVVDDGFVREKGGTPGIAVIDGRNRGFYDGVQVGGSKEQPHKAGHIAGAGSVPFNEITDEQLLLRSADDLRALFAKAGVKPGDTVVGYCHIGQQATAMLFAARTLGHEVRLYDGSFEDWSRRDGPVERSDRR